MLKFCNPLTTWITADTHAFHKNICKGCTSWESGADRDFNNQEEMTKVMANNFNQLIQPNDVLIHLGDWSFGGYQNIKRFRDMLNVKNIFLVTGNHDHHIEEDKNIELRTLFTKVYGEPGQSHYIDVEVAGHKYFCGHYAMLVWDKSHRGVRHCFGHSHGSLPDNPNSLSFDVGVDCHGLKPLNFVQVEEIMKKKNNIPVDHHNKDTN